MFNFISCGWLMARAKNPEDDLVIIFALAIEAIARGRTRPPNLGMGLSCEVFTELLDNYFPAASCEIVDDRFRERYSVDPLESEFEDIVEVLLDHRSSDDRRIEWLAYAVASGCMGSDHLYHDMGLPNRQALSSLLERHFTALFCKNVHNMKWKKFFYKQLCDRAEIIMCPTRNCMTCIDYKNCFAPEEAVLEESLH